MLKQIIRALIISTGILLLFRWVQFQDKPQNEKKLTQTELTTTILFLLFASLLSYFIWWYWSVIDGNPFKGVLSYVVGITPWSTFFVPNAISYLFGYVLQRFDEKMLYVCTFIGFAAGVFLWQSESNDEKYQVAFIVSEILHETAGDPVLQANTLEQIMTSYLPASELFSGVRELAEKWIQRQRTVGLVTPTMPTMPTMPTIPTPTEPTMPMPAMPMPTGMPATTMPTVPTMPTMPTMPKKPPKKPKTKKTLPPPGPIGPAPAPVGPAPAPIGPQLPPMGPPPPYTP